MSAFTELRRCAQPAMTLCCLPFAGGSSAVFRGWRVPADVDLVGVDLPGRATRFGEPLMTTMAEVVAGLLPESRMLPTPFVLYGHSVGAIVAFELTRALERIGRGPAHLVVSGRRAPHLPSPHPPISGLPDEDFARELRRYRGTPEAILADTELMELFLPMLRADFAISESYRFDGGPPISADLTVLGATNDELVDATELGAWARHSTGSCEVHTVAGGHFFLHDVDMGALLSRLGVLGDVGLADRQ